MSWQSSEGQCDTCSHSWELHADPSDYTAPQACQLDGCQYDCQDYVNQLDSLIAQADAMRKDLNYGE